MVEAEFLDTVERNGAKTISQGLRGLVKKFGLWPSDNGRLWEVFEAVRELIKCAFGKIKMFLHKQIL